jgi:hypothetical protein
VTTTKESRLQKILIPEIRKKWKALHNGTSEELENFLKENYFDLQYQAQPHTAPINLGLGHLLVLGSGSSRTIAATLYSQGTNRKGWGISFVVDLLKKTGDRLGV